MDWKWKKKDRPKSRRGKPFHLSVSWGHGRKSNLRWLPSERRETLEEGRRWRK